MIILKGEDKDILTLPLQKILALIEDINIYKWKLIWIDYDSCSDKLAEFKEKVNNSEDGILLDPQELLHAPYLFDNLFDTVLLGDKNNENLHKLNNDNEMKMKCEFFIELVDCSYWEITTKNQSFMQNIKRHFSFEEYSNIK